MLGEEDCCLVWAKAVVAARQKKRTRRNLMACSGMVNDHDYTSAHWSGAASVRSHLHACGRTFAHLSAAAALAAFGHVALIAVFRHHRAFHPALAVLGHHLVMGHHGVFAVLGHLAALAVLAAARHLAARLVVVAAGTGFGIVAGWGGGSLGRVLGHQTQSHDQRTQNYEHLRFHSFLRISVEHRPCLTAAKPW